MHIFVCLRVSELKMKSNKGTQTSLSTRKERVCSSEHDLLAKHSGRIVEITRKIEEEILKSFKGEDESVSEGVLTDDVLDKWIKFRVAAITASVVRNAEILIVDELTKISQLVPHGSEGWSYRHAQVDIASVETTTRPAQPVDVSRLKVNVSSLLEDVNRRKRMLQFEPIEEESTLPTLPTMSSVDSRHNDRMSSLKAIVERFSSPPLISSTSQEGTTTFQSTRAKRYAQLFDEAVHSN